MSGLPENLDIPAASIIPENLPPEPSNIPEAPELPENELKVEASTPPIKAPQGPPANSPRFNQIYGQMKRFERENSELAERLKQLEKQRKEQ